MLKLNYKLTSVPSVLLLAQLSSLLIYLNLNIVNVGEKGTALPLLATYVGISILIFLIIFLQRQLFFRLHLFVFLLFLIWITIRVTIDLSDMEQLKAITVATSGGLLLFYLMGAAFNISYVYFQEKSSKILLGLIILLFLFLMVILLSSLLTRLRSDIFFITGAEDSYQRSGYFLSIMFIIFSVIFLAFSSKHSGFYGRRLEFVFWFSIYTTSTVIALISSQSFGSNSATAVITGIFILTLITLLLMRKPRLRSLHGEGRLVFPFGKQVIRGIFVLGVIGVSSFLILLTLLVQVTDFDIMNTRMLGFGSGHNSSLISRIDIFLQFGIPQMVYARLLGNMNVAYLTTGNAGTTLHSFFPFILANLGLVGLSIALYFFFMIFRQLFRIAKRNSSPHSSLIQALITLYFIKSLMFLLVIANISTGVTWPVIWFTVGFISQPFGFKSRVRA